ncbi:MAG: LarC family nickel insertion protein [Cyanobacteria bacterium]|nr:LarC family nickel insertion protein [Cyanobacteriota bacterium]
MTSDVGITAPTGITLALVDCPTGLAGDMLLAALLDLGLPESVIHEPLEALGLAGLYRLEPEERRSAGLRGLGLRVVALEPQPSHRSWGSVRRQLLEAPLAEPLRQRVLAVFSLLAQAEAAVHGQPADQVHFHEVGAIDALVDIVGVFAAGELTTPTGLALMACWAKRFGPAPAGVPRQVGVGLGSRSLDRPNLLRLILAEPLAPAAPEALPAEAFPAAAALETVLQQQSQIDDATPADLAFLAEALRQEGALEVFSQAIVMKKGRHGFLLTALVEPDRAAALRQVWWRHSSTLGVREQLQPRWRLARQTLELQTGLGPVRLKRASLPGGGERFKPEHDDLVALARRHQLSLAQVRRRVERALEDPVRENSAMNDLGTLELETGDREPGERGMEKQLQDPQVRGHQP